MPSPLVIPGVQVRTLFEPSPMLPGATGILGVVGVVDRGPLEPTPVGNVGELVDVFGPATRFTMPEVRTALANGVAQVVVARTAPGGQKATLKLKDDDGEEVVTLTARAEGAWGNQLAVRVTQVKGSSGRGIKFVNLEVLYAGQTIETFNGLVMDEDSADYLFTRINQGSRVIVATDPNFEAGLPVDTSTIKADGRIPFVAASPAVAAKATVGDFTATANRPGRGGNQSVVIVRNAQPGLIVNDGAAQAKPSVDIARKDGITDAVDIQIEGPPAGGGKSKLTVFRAGASQSPVEFDSVDALIAGLKNNAIVTAEKLGNGLPAPLARRTLEPRIDIEVTTEGRDSRQYRNIASAAAISNIKDPVVGFSTAQAAPSLPPANTYPLAGGRNQGPALALPGDTSSDPLVELVPASEASSDVAVQVQRPAGTAVVNVFVFRGADIVESFPGLTMDPDDPNYLIDVLSTSATLRARDLFERSKAENFPRAEPRPRPLAGGTSPSPSDYGDALDRLEGAEEVDLVIASVANQLPIAADVLKVQQLVVAHCTKMADVARNRIGLSSVSAAENRDITGILDHVESVRSDHFILSTPAGSEAALAGLLGRQDYFQSPTFKTIASPETALITYSDAQLTKLVPANVAVIAKKRGRGIICVKGLLTSGRQINVQRTANKAVRDTKAIADKYIGLLNDEGTRNALRQQIIALLLQMERDGAIVPSTDGQDPAFKVDVYSSQADFANGIVRIDIAIRPVRAIDYVYATILVKN